MARRVWTRAGVSGLFAIFFFSIVLAATASAANPANSSKPYSIVICGNGQMGCTAGSPNAVPAIPAFPAVIAPGGTASDPLHPAATITVTFKNNNKPGSGIKLGSDNLSVPTTPGDFSFLSTAPPDPFPQPCQLPLSQQAPPCFYVLDASG
ncbi:MAG: hypothetical protein ACJ780_29940, partial [Solirubrobacteraceae bacterium]